MLHKIWAASFLVLTFPVHSQSVPARIANVDRFLARAVAFHQFNGVALVAQGGKVLYEKAFGIANMEWEVPNASDSRFEIASMTKPITAIAIMQLVEEGKLRLDGHVSEYVPFYPHATGDRIRSTSCFPTLRGCSRISHLPTTPTTSRRSFP